ncbi:MAG: glycosyltransferase family 39 protein [Roseivirga sp.]
MIPEGDFSRLETRYILGVFILLVVALFVNLGIYPLFLEEPRRGLIALEMIFRDNWWVPTQTGDLYLRKPPLYNWTLILSYKLFGEYSELATRVVSVVSLIGMGVSTFLFTRRYLGFKVAVLSALGVLTSVDILFYFSTLGEIDLFYSWITLMSFFGLYHYGEKEKYWPLFLIIYGLSALGILTKGLSSVPFLGISVLVYFLYTRKFRKLFSLAHFGGIALFVFIVGGYFYMYSLYEDPSGWWQTLVGESAGRAGSGGLLNHLFSFPLENLKNVMPATLLIPLFWRKDLIKRIKGQKVISLLLVLFLANFLVYWVSAEAKSRYVYALYPLLIIAFSYLYVHREGRVWHEKYWKVLISICLIIPTIGLPVFPFIDFLAVVDNRIWISLGLLSFIALLWWLFLTKRVSPYLILFGLLIMARLWFSMVVPVTRAETTGAAEDRTLGKKIAAESEGAVLYRYGDVRMSLTIVYYVEAGREEVLRQTDTFEPGYFFCYTDDLPTEGYEVLEEFYYHQKPIFLIRVE